MLADAPAYRAPPPTRQWIIGFTMSSGLWTAILSTRSGAALKIIFWSSDWGLKCRFQHASLHRSMTVMTMKRIVRATSRIANGVFTLLCLIPVEAL